MTESTTKFRNLSKDQKIATIAKAAKLTADELNILSKGDGGISYELADHMVENAIGTFALPLGIATNFVINGKDVWVPMAIEEPSVIAAASKGAKIAGIHGGFFASASKISFVIGQIQLLKVPDITAATTSIKEHTQQIIDIANSQSTTLAKMGKGAIGVNSKVVDTPSGKMLIVELMVDAGDAMGANVTNTMCEAISPLLERITKGRALLRILSNYSTKRMAQVHATFDKDAIGGAQVVDDIIMAFEFADSDMYRAVTHNKGVMNGIIAVANATGQDSRAIDVAAAGAFASKTGRYRSLTRWSKTTQGDLYGSLEIPLAVGTVGGIASVHPTAKLCIKILGASTSQDLAKVMVSVGLAQNFGALRALVTEGIQKGHMRLHAGNLAIAVGAPPVLVDRVSQIMISEKKVTPAGALEALADILKQ